MEPGFWKGRRVLVTGHTGFKGAWLSLWLHSLGANVSGLSLGPVGDPDLWSQLDLPGFAHHQGDVRNSALLDRILQDERPEIVFHLAAQSLVRPSYADPLETFSTNIMGTATVLDAMTRSQDVRAGVMVTSDKCYENRERGDAYVETDPMGGHDPYSASKGCAELVTASMRRSFFSARAKDGHGAAIASGRAGNVIGGGDWSQDRLVPDIVRGCLGRAGHVVIRSPRSVRPWQHVLEPLNGYLSLAQALIDGQEGAESGWNFGPDSGTERPVIDVAEAIVAALGRGRIDISEEQADLHEAKLLSLNSTKARALGWAPVWGFEETIAQTASWYARNASGESAQALCREQIEQFTNDLGATS